MVGNVSILQEACIYSLIILLPVKLLRTQSLARLYCMHMAIKRNSHNQIMYPFLCPYSNGSYEYPHNY